MLIFKDWEYTTSYKHNQIKKLTNDCYNFIQINDSNTLYKGLWVIGFTSGLDEMRILYGKLNYDYIEECSEKDLKDKIENVINIYNKLKVFI